MEYFNGEIYFLQYYRYDRKTNWTKTSDGINRTPYNWRFAKHYGKNKLL